MEIPSVKLELYQRDPELFSTQIGQALENIGVIQVDGLKQALLDELYESSEEALGRYGSLCYHYLEYSPNKSQRLYRQLVQLTSNTNCNPAFDSLVREVKRDLDEIYRKVTLGISTYKKDLHFHPVNLTNLMLVKYSPEEKDLSALGNAPEEIILQEAHYDARKITIAPRATAPGFEGYVKNEWLPLYPDYGNALVFTGSNSLNPLKHRIRAHSPFTKTRKALVFGS